jgi:tetratricopeptide (TPR) repeat protein
MPDFETEFDKYYAKAVDLLERRGSTAEVYEYIRTIDDEDYRAGTFDKLAQFLAGQGNLAEALRYCAAIGRPLEHADALFEVGRVLRRNRDFAAAKNVFDQTVGAVAAVECDYDKAAVLLQVANQLERLGHKDEALTLVYRAVELAKPVPQNHQASKTLRGCARTLTMWNRLSEAVAVAELIDSRWSALRETTLEEIRGRGKWPVHPGPNPEDDG